MTLHEFLDIHYEGDAQLRQRLEAGADVNQSAGPDGETPLHVATRRCRTGAVLILLDHGVDIDAKTAHGKTAYAHAVRRGFSDIAWLLQTRNADTTLNPADELAVALSARAFQRAREILEAHPGIAKTGNPEEDRLLADMAGRNESESVQLLIEAGADLTARGLDDGTPLHQAAWFGQPQNARLLIDSGAPLDVFERVHQSSPLHWAIHGSRFSGGAEERQDEYIALVELLIGAGSRLTYPDDPESNAYVKRMYEDASPQVREVLERLIG